MHDFTIHAAGCRSSSNGGTTSGGRFRTAIRGIGPTFPNKFLIIIMSFLLYFLYKVGKPNKSKKRNDRPLRNQIATKLC